MAGPSAFVRVAPPPPGVRGMERGGVAGVGPGPQQMTVGDGAGRNERGVQITQTVPSVSGVGGGAGALAATSGSSGGGQGAAVAGDARP